MKIVINESKVLEIMDSSEPELKAFEALGVGSIDRNTYIFVMGLIETEKNEARANRMERLRVKSQIKS